jgi:hypothetical protein
MAATTISRSNIGTNDDGSGTTGTVINVAYINLIYDNIDALFSAAGGVTFNQGTGDAAIIMLESSDVAHGMTGFAGTAVYCAMSKFSATLGGVNMLGLSEGQTSVQLQGFATTVDTTKTTAGVAPIMMYAALKNGTSNQAVSANGNLMAIQNLGTTRFIFDAEGDGHADVSWTTFDTHDDLALLTSLEGELAGKDALRSEFHDWMTYNRDSLAKSRLVTFDDNGQTFVNFTRLSMALCGAVRQLGSRLAATEAKLAALKA